MNMPRLQAILFGTVLLSAQAPPFTARAFGLYSSWRTDKGSIYRLERSYALG